MENLIDMIDKFICYSYSTFVELLEVLAEIDGAVLVPYCPSSWIICLSFRYYLYMTFFSFQVLSRLCRQPIIIYIPEREVILPVSGIIHSYRVTGSLVQICNILL